MSCHLRDHFIAGFRSGGDDPVLDGAGHARRTTQVLDAVPEAGHSVPCILEEEEGVALPSDPADLAEVHPLHWQNLSAVDTEIEHFGEEALR